MTLHAVQPGTDLDGDVDQVTKVTRERALRLVDAGLPLDAGEFAALRRIGLSYFYKQEKRGTFEEFLLRPADGPRRFSGVLIGRWLRGEPLTEPTFGRRKRA